MCIVQCAWIMSKVVTPPSPPPPTNTMGTCNKPFFVSAWYTNKKVPVKNIWPRKEYVTIKYKEKESVISTILDITCKPSKSTVNLYRCRIASKSYLLCPALNPALCIHLNNMTQQFWEYCHVLNNKIRALQNWVTMVVYGDGGLHPMIKGPVE